MDDQAHLIFRPRKDRTNITFPLLQHQYGGVQCQDEQQDEIATSRAFSFDEEEVGKLQKVLSVLKSLTNIFKNTKTPHFRAFRLLENAAGTLQDLEEFIPYAKIVKDELGESV